jgi:steroid delta-isomerase-like uncharacterized protein
MKTEKAMRVLILAPALLLAACGNREPEAKPDAGFVATVPAAPAAAPATASAPPAGQVGARRVLDRWLAAWNSHDASQAEVLLADDVEYFDAGFSGIQKGRDAAMEKGFSVFLRGVPDLHIELRGEPIVSPDAVAWEWTFSGTHTGTWGGVPATNQQIRLKGFSLLRLRNGKIVQISSYYDTGTLNRQLGL